MLQRPTHNPAVEAIYRQHTYTHTYIPEKFADDLKMPVHAPDEVLGIPWDAAFEGGEKWSQVKNVTSSCCGHQLQATGTVVRRQQGVIVLLSCLLFVGGITSTAAAAMFSLRSNFVAPDHATAVVPHETTARHQHASQKSNQTTQKHPNPQQRCSCRL